MACQSTSCKSGEVYKDKGAELNADLQHVDQGVVTTDLTPLKQLPRSLVL